MQLSCSAACTLARSHYQPPRFLTTVSDCAIFGRRGEIPQGGQRFPAAR
jgi:hypothetical protein